MKPPKRVYKSNIELQQKNGLVTVSRKRTMGFRGEGGVGVEAEGGGGGCGG